MICLGKEVCALRVLHLVLQRFFFPFLYAVSFTNLQCFKVYIYALIFNIMMYFYLMDHNVLKVLKMNNSNDFLFFIVHATEVVF